VAIDLDGDGLTNGSNEGFIKVYQSSDEAWLSASRPTNTSTSVFLRDEDNCGHATASHGGVFVNAAAHPLEPSGDSWADALKSATRRCYLGGDSALNNAFVANDGKGQWLAWPGAVSPLVAGRPDAQYLFPITRALNPNFKGVIFVDGKVVISGVLRGRVTVAATSEIIIGDDVTYATDPAAGTCNDILGVFSGVDIVVADNTVNAPIRATSSTTYYSFDETRDEFVHGVMLALDNFTVENYSSGATNSEDCGTTDWGRGCLYLTGGIIQKQRGAVGTTSGTGNLKRYSYDQCAFTNPPPYFPTTGVFARGRYYEIDPVGFDVDALFTMLTPTN
jgi:hypothetical protein